VFDGSDPVAEGISALELVRQVEVARSLHSPKMTEGQLVLMITSRFKKGGRAWGWWQLKLSQCDPSRGELPFVDWTDFKQQFLHDMEGVDEATQLRIQLDTLRMKDRDLLKYITEFRSTVTKLASRDVPLSEGEAVFKFARGLRRSLRNKCPLRRGTSLAEAVRVVTEKFYQNSLQDLFEDHARPAKPAKFKSKLHVVMTDSEDEGESTDNEDESADNGGAVCAAVQAKPLRKSKPKFQKTSSAANSGASGSGTSQPRQNADNCPRNLTEKQQQWWKAGHCIECGSPDHFARDCPRRKNGKQRENSKG
jgi:hypothetical protein